MNTVITAINSIDNNNLLIKDFPCLHYPAYPTPIAHTQLPDSGAWLKT